MFEFINALYEAKVLLPVMCFRHDLRFSVAHLDYFNFANHTLITNAEVASISAIIKIEGNYKCYNEAVTPFVVSCLLDFVLYFERLFSDSFT